MNCVLGFILLSAPWEIANLVASILAACAALLAVVLAVPQLRHNAQALQLQVFESIFKDIRELDHSWIEKDFRHKMTVEEKKAWCASFFNTVEYLCFLVNHGMMRSKELHDFFKLALEGWWKQFEKYRGEDLFHDDERSFIEFKKICNRGHKS